MSKASKTRRVVANISLSLDGRINGPEGDHDMMWIVPHAITESSRNHMVRVTEGATTALLGRKNYEGFGGYWPSVADDPGAAKQDRMFSRWLNETEKVVFSSKLTDGPWQNSRIVNSDPAEEVARLRETGSGDMVVLASSSVIRSLLEADAIDRLSITLCPEIVGGGARLFEDVSQASSWSLNDVTTTESGALCLIYDRVREG